MQSRRKVPLESMNVEICVLGKGENGGGAINEDYSRFIHRCNSIIQGIRGLCSEGFKV